MLHCQEEKAARAKIFATISSNATIRGAQRAKVEAEHSGWSASPFIRLL